MEEIKDYIKKRGGYARMSELRSAGFQARWHIWWYMKTLKSPFLVPLRLFFLTTNQELANS